MSQFVWKSSCYTGRREKQKKVADRVEVTKTQTWISTSTTNRNGKRKEKQLFFDLKKVWGRHSNSFNGTVTSDAASPVEGPNDERVPKEERGITSRSTR